LNPLSSILSHGGRGRISKSILIGRG